MQSEWHDNMNDMSKILSLMKFVLLGHSQESDSSFRSLTSTGSITNGSQSLSQSLSSAEFWIATTHSAICSAISCQCILMRVKCD